MRTPNAQTQTLLQNQQTRLSGVIQQARMLQSDMQAEKQRQHQTTMQDDAQAHQTERQEAGFAQAEKNLQSQQQHQTTMQDDRQSHAQELQTAANDFAAKQAEINRKFQAEGREDSQAHALELRKAANDFAEKQAEINRTFQTGEREAGQDFTAEQNRLNREHQQKLQQQAESHAIGLKMLNTSVSGLSKEELARLEQIRKDPQFIKVLTRMGDIQGGYDTGIQGFVDAMQGKVDGQTESDRNPGFSIADMAMINGFQRMIDPGVSVHEGDVAAMLGTEGLDSQLAVILQRVAEEGGRFTEATRREMAQMIINQYNSNIRGTYGSLVDEAQRYIDLAGLTGKVRPTDVSRTYRMQTLTVDQILEQGHGGIPALEPPPTTTQEAPADGASSQTTDPGTSGND